MSFSLLLFLVLLIGGTTGLVGLVGLRKLITWNAEISMSYCRALSCALSHIVCSVERGANAYDALFSSHSLVYSFLALLIEGREPWIGFSALSFLGLKPMHPTMGSVCGGDATSWSEYRGTADNNRQQKFLFWQNI